jgi:hypothetical protein
MNIINQIITILTAALPVLLIVFNNRLAGLKVKLASVLMIVSGGWTIISTSMLPQLCEQLHLFCNIQNTGLFGTVEAVIGFLALIYRNLQGNSVPLSEFPARLMGKKK